MSAPNVYAKEWNVVDQPESWRPIAGLDGRYEVSDLGRVRGVERLVERGQRPMVVKARILALCENRHPPRSANVRCLTVAMSKENKTHTRAVHRLVLEAFLGPPPEGMEGCHCDGDVRNNRLDNLRWDTHAENVADIKRHGRTSGPKKPSVGERHGRSKLTDSAVREIRAAEPGPGFLRALADRHGVSVDTVRLVRAGRVWRHLLTEIAA